MTSLTSTWASALPAAVVMRARPPSVRAKRRSVFHTHAQRTVGITLPPRRITKDVVSREGPPLAGPTGRSETRRRSDPA